MSGGAKQRAAFEFLRKKRGRLFTTEEFAAAASYTPGTAGTHLSEHWAEIIERTNHRWRTKPFFLRLTYEEFLAAISQSRRGSGALSPRRYLLLDASAVVPFYVPSASRSAILVSRIKALVGSVREGKNASFLYMPTFCIAETFSVFMKHRFGAWNRHVKKRLSDRQYRTAVEHFEADIHNGRLIYQYELNRYHVLGINLVAPIDHHYQMMRPNRPRSGGAAKRSPQPAGTFDQLIVSMGVQLAHVHGAANTIVVTADQRLARLIDRCRRPMKLGARRLLGVDRCEAVVGRPFQPETFPNVVDLQRASKREASERVGCVLPR